MLEWDEKYATGVDTIDGQHRYIFEAINEFGESINRNKSIDVKGVLDQLANYTRIHFKFEENCMNNYKCPAAEQNKGEHEKFMAAIERFQRQMKYEGVNVPLAKQVHRAAESWIQNHIMRVDINLKPCVHRQKEEEDKKVERLEWDDAYATGVETVDHHHKYLFESINELGDMLDHNKNLDGLGDILVLLTDYTRVHFKFEENCMNRLQCPVADKNQDEHKKFMTAIERFQRELRFKDPDKELLEKVHTAAVNWLKNHIIRVDTHLRSCVDSPGAIQGDKDVIGIN